MNKHFNIKNITIFAFMFICFFTLGSNVKAANLTCNYRLDGGQNENAVAFTLKYSTTGSSVTVDFNKDFVSQASGGNGFKSQSVDFTPSEAGASCPKTLFSVNSWKIDDMKIRLFLSYSDAKEKITDKKDKKTYDIDNEGRTYTLINSVDTKSEETCEYYEYLNGTKSNSGNKIIIYYKKNSSEVPNITFNGKFSDSSNKYVANFKGSDIKNCPYQVYSTSSNKNDYGNSTTIETKTFYLNSSSIGSKKYTTYGNEKYGSSDDKNSGAYVVIDDDNSNVDEDSIAGRCAKIEGVKKYITWTYNLLRFAIPTLIIVLSTIEFIGVVLSGEDEKMEKAKKHFIIRLIIGIVAILVPFLLEFILKLGGFIDADLSDLVCNVIKK